jgi:hypothetical protein
VLKQKLVRFEVFTAVRMMLFFWVLAGGISGTRDLSRKIE